MVPSKCSLNQSVDIDNKVCPSLQILQHRYHEFMDSRPHHLHLHTGGKMLSALSVWKPRNTLREGGASKFKLQPFSP